MKKRWTAALLALCFVLSLAPYALAVGKPLGSAEPSVLYVSESGSNDKDGTSEENATTLDHATEIANDKGGPVQIVVVGIVSVDMDKPHGRDRVGREGRGRSSEIPLSCDI